MSAASAASADNRNKGILGKIEEIGNKVPHPAMIFVYLIVFVILLSTVLGVLGVGITEEMLVPAEPEQVTVTDWGGTDAPIQVYPESYAPGYVVQEVTTTIRPLLSIEGIRFIFTSFVNNFAGFSVVAVIFVAMIGVGVAEEAGMMGALIRKLVAVAPGSLLTFIIILIGGLSSVATDAGYLILIPLGAAAFLSVGKNPIAGVAAAYAGVSGAFAVNILLAPVDALLTEMTNEAIAIAAPGQTITITANYFFSAVSTIVMAVIMTFITVRLIEPRLGKYDPVKALGQVPGEGGPDIVTPDDGPVVDEAAESRGLSAALRGFLIGLVVILLLTVPPGAPLRHPETGEIIGQTPFMDSLIFIISMLFLVAGIGYGRGAGTIKSSNDVIAGITKTFASLAGLVFILLLISQFIALFNWSNLPNIIAGGMAQALEQASVPPIMLLIGMILVVCVLDIIIPGVLPKWAIFAPIFVPLFMRLGIAPQTVLAAYRIGDSPINVITPLMVYLPFIVIVAQRYDKSVGIGTIISLMIPYTFIILITWVIFFVIWYTLGIPLGPGYPVVMP
ncbi:MAG: AbgT family transporter [Thermomicrobiales bacterium]|jgi:aminobenzoyl-glutamate transport protein